ncbi:MAG: (2Fe-2S) ferredoxin domain-containing protein [Candidatus Omnitrophica bacterium]|nr:(2Fe-2S) ferredoxin domain-containing protein [Candidatus Omnitrophota bacterium]
MAKITKEQLDGIKAQSVGDSGNWVRVGMSTCGIAAGADKTFEKLTAQMKERELEVRVERCGCAGKCFAEPLVEVAVEGMPVVIYGRVDENVAVEIVDKHILGKKLLNDHIYSVKAG